MLIFEVAGGFFTLHFIHYFMYLHTYTRKPGTNELIQRLCCYVCALLVSGLYFLNQCQITLYSIARNNQKNIPFNTYIHSQVGGGWALLITIIFLFKLRTFANCQNYEMPIHREKKIPRLKICSMDKSVCVCKDFYDKGKRRTPANTCTEETLALALTKTKLQTLLFAH